MIFVNNFCSFSTHFRTIFHFGRDLVQVVLHPDDVTLPWLEKRADSNEQSFKDAFDHEDASSIASDINASLSTTPGFRLTIYTSTPNTHFFVLSIHHALFDGVSLPVLLKDVEREYLQERLIPFPYSAAVLDQLYRIDLRRAQHFWTQYFSDFNWQDNVIRSPSTNVRDKANLT